MPLEGAAAPISLPPQCDGVEELCKGVCSQAASNRIRRESRHRSALTSPHTLAHTSQADGGESDSESSGDEGEGEPGMLPGKVTVPPQRVYPVRAFVTRPFRVLVHLYQADGLPAADANGSSDAYCIVRVGADRFTQTQVFTKTLTPSFLATCELDVQLPVYNVHQMTFEEPSGPITKPVKGKGGVGPSPLGPGGGVGKAGAAAASVLAVPRTTPRGLERFAQTKSAMKSSSLNMDMRLPNMPEHTQITTVVEGETMPLLAEERQTAAQIMEVAQIRQPAHPEGTQVRLWPSWRLPHSLPFLAS